MKERANLYHTRSHHISRSCTGTYTELLFEVGHEFKYNVNAELRARKNVENNRFDTFSLEQRSVAVGLSVSQYIDRCFGILPKKRIHADLLDVHC